MLQKDITVKKVGIIGGIGPESTIQYYRFIIKQFQEKLGTEHYPELLLHSIDMTRMLEFISNNKLNELANFLTARIHVLEKANVDLVALASNTPHIVLDQIKKNTSVQIVSIVEETCKKIAFAGINNVILLGTKSTMEYGFYQRTAESFGIQIVVPDESDRNFIHGKYMSELVFNSIVPKTKSQFLEIIQSLQSSNTQGLILGGTELPLLLQQKDFDGLKVFNTTRIHVHAIVDRMTA